MKKVVAALSLLLFSVALFGFAYQSVDTTSSALAIRKYQAINTYLRARLNDWTTSFQVLAYAIRSHGIDDGELHRLSALLQKAHPVLRTVIIVTPDGTVAADSREGQPSRGRKVNDRAYFAAHQDPGAAPVFLGAPVRSRVDGHWSVPFSVAVRGPEQQLLAVIASGIDPGMLSGKIHRTFAYGDYQAVIVDAADDVITTVPYDESGYTMPFRQWLGRERQAGLWNRLTGFFSVEAAGSPASGPVTFTTHAEIRGRYVLENIVSFTWKGLLAAVVLWTAAVWHLRRQENVKRLLTDAKINAEELADQAREANEAKSQFLASMSHELRTPLRAILGFSDMISRESLGQVNNRKYVDYAHHIHQSGEHLLAIINDVLDLSKIEAGKAKLDLTRFELETEILAAIKLIGRGGRETGRQFDVEIADGAGELVADIRAFRQIMVNLLSNADKYSPEDAAVSIAARTGTTGSTIIEITDRGIGVPPEDLARILEPFGQARTNAQLAHDGTGLGLPVSKGLMELHGGAMEIESEVGRGTSVRLNFPRRAIPAGSVAVS